MVGKKAAVLQVNEMRLKELDSRNVTRIVSTAVDEMRQVNSDQYCPADERLIRAMDQELDEKASLVIYLNSIMQFTVNRPNNIPPYYQGQSFLIESMEEVSGNQILNGRIIPPGERFTYIETPHEDWPRLSLRKSQLQDIFFGRQYGVFARRKQFCLRYAFASTVHRAMGDTISHVAVKISSTEDAFNIWERGQITVMISRVRNLTNLMFVGPWAETEAALMKVFDKDSGIQLAMIDERMKRLNILVLTSESHSIHHYKQNVTPLCRSLPADDTGFVYMAVSARNPKEYKFHAEWDIRRHLRTLNSGGSLDVQRANRPYVPAFYITGFPGERMSIENYNHRCQLIRQIEAAQWHYIHNANSTLTYAHAMVIAEIITFKSQFRNMCTYVHCLQVTDEIENSVRTYMDSLRVRMIN